MIALIFFGYLFWALLALWPILLVAVPLWIVLHLWRSKRKRRRYEEHQSHEWESRNINRARE